ncbi:MAG: ERCC4 domain-containing protein, partial [Nanoarchaeota archaeon]
MSAKFLDIFSTAKKEKVKNEKPKPKIIVDYREKNSLVSSVLVNLGVEIEFKNLKVGDYIVNEVAVERKTVSDFISSMINKRLSNQLEELQQYKKKLLIVEGIDEQELYSDSEERTGMHPNAIRGFLLSILLKYNV